MSTTKIYRLGSSGFIYTPGIVRWAINGYRFPGDRKTMVKVIAEGWGVPEAAAVALLSGAAPYVAEPDGTVVFSVEGKSEPEPEPERPTYFVEATYATPNGNTGRWSGRMASKSGDILADAERIVRKYRRVAGKLDIKATAIR